MYRSVFVSFALAASVLANPYPQTSGAATLTIAPFSPGPSAVVGPALEIKPNGATVAKDGLGGTWSKGPSGKTSLVGPLGTLVTGPTGTTVAGPLGTISSGKGTGLLGGLLGGMGKGM
jgi:hypothetical protein